MEGEARPMESILNPLGFATLLTSLYVLRFRGWKKPLSVLFYFAFFATLEIVTTHYFLRRGAFGIGLAYVCFGLTVPVVVATFLVYRHELRHDEKHAHSVEPLQ